MLLVGVALAIAVQFGWVSAPRAPLRLVVAGPMSGPDAASGQAMVRGAQLYLDEVNERGGVGGRRIELVVRDDRNRSDEAERIASAIAADDDTLVVLGHFSSQTSIAAAPYYEAAGIPVITASATSDAVTAGRDLHFRVIANNSLQGSILASYARNVLEKQSAGVIFGLDEYGVSLKESFERAAVEAGLAVERTWPVDGSADNVGATLKSIVSELKAGGMPAILFLATHARAGVEIIRRLKYAGVDVPILGADALAGEGFLRELRRTPEERARPGYFSDGVYAASPFIVDIANEQGQRFRFSHEKQFGMAPSWISAGYHDAALAAVQAMEDAGLGARAAGPTESRRRVGEALRGFFDYPRSLRGVTGDIYFDENGDTINPMPVGVWQRQHLISAPWQLQPVSTPNAIDNILREILENRILLINERYYYKTAVVYAGLDINDVSNLDLEQFTYKVNFFLWFRFAGELDDDAIEFANALSPIELGEPIMERVADGITTRAYQAEGEFRSQFDFSAYPFDRQQLRMKFRHREHARDDLIYVSDTLGMRPELDSEKFFGTVSGWRADAALFYQDVVKNDSTLGMGELIEREFSEFNAAIGIARDVPSFVLKNLFPVIFLLLVSYVAYFLPGSQSTMRVGLGTSTLLTAAFLHHKLSSDLGVAYLVAIEYFFFSVYALAALVVLIAVRDLNFSEQLKDEDLSDDARARIEVKMARDAWIGRVVHPLTIMAVSYLLVRRFG